MNVRAECLVLSADRRRESDAVSFIGSLLLVGSSSRSDVGSWCGGVLDYQDAISRPPGTADDAAPAGRATRGSRRTPAPKSVGALGDLVDVRDLGVGQPRRRFVPHSTMPPANRPPFRAGGRRHARVQSALFAIRTYARRRSGTR